MGNREPSFLFPSRSIPCPIGRLFGSLKKSFRWRAWARRVPAGISAERFSLSRPARGYPNMVDAAWLTMTIRPEPSTAITPWAALSSISLHTSVLDCMSFRSARGVAFALRRVAFFAAMLPPVSVVPTTGPKKQNSLKPYSWLVLA